MNEALEVVYHSLVKPDTKIVNYLTQYSGITKELLANVDTRLVNVSHLSINKNKIKTAEKEHWSGLKNTEKTFFVLRLADVQQALQNLLPPDCILVGQSLNSDLNALKMMHPYVIDTSVIFNITGERCVKLKIRNRLIWQKNCIPKLVRF